ncbi:hypothetical protein BDF22DRAFT_744479 [Syncephalis plumigaleata]|nr:hypothetical protein BDF22DRAFT_744479 [Syncephalis plumigaleata]
MVRRRPVLLPHRFLGQNYHWIRLKQKRRGRGWIDPLFPPDATSLGPRFAHLPGIVWYRPWEITSHARFVGRSRKYKISGVIQGAIGNCWLVTTIGLVAQRRNLMRRLVPYIHRQDWSPFQVSNHPSVYRFQFYRLGRWVEVLVDDLLPYDTINGRMLFARSTDPHEFWVSLLEKAYAKLLGSYDALDAGSAADAILDFTSAVVESWPIRHPIPLPIGMHQQSPEIKQRMKAMDEEMDKRWKQLRGYIQSGSLTSCAILPRDNTYIDGNTGPAIPFPLLGTAPAILPDGLMAAHSYGILDAVEVVTRRRPNIRLVLLLDPWGEANWRGRWTNRLEGIFWMAFEDFQARFDMIQVGRCVNTRLLSFRQRWTQRRFHDRWCGLDGTAGGCTNFDGSIAGNPQYLMMVKEKNTEVLISLQQGKRLRKRGHPTDRSAQAGYEEQQLVTATAVSLPAQAIGTASREGNFVIGFLVMRVEENRKTRLTEPHNVVAAAPYQNAREVVLRIRLPIGRYVVLPTTFAPGEEADFLLRVYSKPAVFTARLIESGIEPPWWKRMWLSICQGFSDITPRASAVDRDISYNKNFTGRWTVRIVRAVFPREKTASDSTLGCLAFMQNKPPFRDVYFLLDYNERKTPLETRASRVAWQAGGVATWDIDYVFPVADPVQAKINLHAYATRVGRDDELGVVSVSVSRFAVDERVGGTWEIVLPLLPSIEDSMATDVGVGLAPAGEDLSKVWHVVLRVCYQSDD